MQLRFVKVHLEVECTQQKRWDVLRSGMRLAMGRPTQLANRGALSDQPSPARILDFFTILNNLEFSKIVHSSLRRYLCKLLGSFKSLASKPINILWHLPFLLNIRPHTHNTSTHIIHTSSLALVKNSLVIFSFVNNKIIFGYIALFSLALL